MHEYETGAVREEKDGKGRMDLLPMCALIRLSKHYEKGSVDHGERNWEKGLPIHSFIDSALRHLAKYVDGKTDEDHLCAAAWNILGAMWTEEKLPEMQDIPSRLTEASPLASEHRDGTQVPSERKTQRKATERPEEKCTYWHPELRSYTELPQCWGTKEMEGCTCNGYKSKCNFYST